MNTFEQNRRVRELIVIFFVMFFLCTLVTAGIAQEKTITEQSAKDKVSGAEKNSKPAKVIIRARSRGDFVGTVTHVNMVSKTVTVKNKGIVVTFDVLNPVLKGYKSLEQIRVGDKIAISYTGDGARITRATGEYIASHQQIAKPIPESSRQKHGSAKTDKGRPVRIKERTNSRLFRDVDNNNDGRITPVELSAVIPNLTVEDFKKYDRNGDGCLNEAEYNAINKSVIHGYNR